jgi:hypothetical protein
MTLREILNLAMDESKETISDTDFLRYLNNSVRELVLRYDTAKKPATQTIVCTDTNEWYSLNSGLALNRVLDSSNLPYSRYDIRIDDSKIQFASSGTYTVYYMTDQTALTSMASVLSVNEVYHRPLAFRVASMATEDEKLSAQLMTISMSDAEMTNKSLRKMQSKYKRVYAPRFR